MQRRGFSWFSSNSFYCRLRAELTTCLRCSSSLDRPGFWLVGVIAIGFWLVGVIAVGFWLVGVIAAELWVVGVIAIGFWLVGVIAVARLAAAGRGQPAAVQWGHIHGPAGLQELWRLPICSSTTNSPRNSTARGLRSTLCSRSEANS